MQQFEWIEHQEAFEICQLASAADVWSQLQDYDAFFSLVQTKQEISVVCQAGAIKEAISRSTDWRLLELKGPLDLQLTGVMATITDILAQAGVSVFTLATYNTDFILVRNQQYDVAIDALKSAGHAVMRAA